MIRVAVLVFAIVASWAGSAWAQESRIALVVGNGAYQNVDPLRNPVNDARAMAKALGDAGFEVVLVENATRRSFTNALREFTGKLTPGGVGLFYYAGHGMQVRGANYLLPVDAALSNEDELRYETIDLNDVMGRFEEARTRLSLVILDACRDNPFAKRFRSTSRGLAQTDAPRGTVIAYATAPGDTAADGESGGNGLYTSELLKAMVVPGLQLEDVFKRTIDGVARASNSKQTPWVSSSFRGAFYFHGAAPGTAPAPSSPPPAAQPADLELAAWNAIATSSNPEMFEIFLKRFPGGVYADFARARLQELKAAEARTAAADDAKRKATTTDDAKRKADADAEAKRKADADAEAKRKADADAEAKRVAAADEAKRKADADAKRTVNVPAAGVARYDGSWSTQLTCDAVPNGPAGYTFAFMLAVRNGEISGQRVSDQGSRLSFRGKIEPNGSAIINVEGISGDAKYNAGNAPRGSNVSFAMSVQFADRDARGTRIGTRPCTIVMKR